MSTRCDRRGPPGPAEQLALVAAARRELLLRVHGHRLPREDLEDCLSQATLELLASLGAGRRFEGAVHMGRALEQRFISRIHDRRRALSGRSPMQAALHSALPLVGPDGADLGVHDPQALTEERVLARAELRRLLELAPQLSPDQRLLIACQVALELDCREFCNRFGWSVEKYRKVSQRARARLRVLLEEDRASNVGTNGRCPGRRVASDERAGTNL